MAYKFNPFTGTLDDVGSGGSGSVPDPLTIGTLTVTSLLTAEHIHGNVAGTVYIHVKNLDTVSLAKGTPFYISGTVGASDRVEIKAADASDPTKGPAIGLVEDTLAVNGQGNGVLLGEIFQYNTLAPGWSTNDPLYVAAGGGLTNVKPTSGFRQVIGYAGRIDNSTGTIIVVSNAADPVAGSDTQIQYNDDGGFGASADLTWDDTAKELGVGGDITLSGQWTSTLNGAASAPPVVVAGSWFTGGTGTTTKPQFLIEPAGTTSTAWSTNGTGLGVNAPSGFTGNLLDLQVNGARVLHVTNAGALSFPAASNTRFQLQAYGTNALGFYLTDAGPYYAWSSSQGYFQGSGTFIGWNSAGNLNTGSVDLALFRDAANTLAQQNGTNAQTYRLYNTYTDASNYERFSLSWNSNVLNIANEANGTGTLRGIAFNANGAASTPPVSLTGTWFTGGTSTTTKPQFLVEPAGTTSTAWSTNGTGLGVNAPSGFTGNLLDLQVDGTSQLSFGFDGRIVASSILAFSTTSSHRFDIAGAAGPFFVQSNQIRVANFGITFCEGSNYNAPEFSILRDAANTLAQQNGTNAQTYRLYNTYTDASNYERGFLQWNSGVFEIGTEGAGTGSEQPVRITAATLNIPNLPEYADDSAAGTGGLVAGDVYKTSTGELRIKL